MVYDPKQVSICVIYVLFQTDILVNTYKDFIRLKVLTI